jgi:hypothetical protein
MISPVFERIAEEKGGRRGVAFAKIDTAVGMGGNVAAEFGIRVAPTFIFFLDGKKVNFPASTRFDDSSCDRYMNSKVQIRPNCVRKSTFLFIKPTHVRPTLYSPKA